MSVRLFLADGSAEGLRLVEKSNWTGLAVVCSRTQYPEVRVRDEFGRPGVYVLQGPSPDASGRDTIYIDQADVARERLDSHLRNKDWWTRLVLFTSKDANLNKAHIQYLESRLIARATDTRLVNVENGNSPRLPALSEADRADAEAFLDDMLLVYPVLGITAFDLVHAPRPDGGGDGYADRLSKLFLRSRGADARGEDTPEGFVVFAGSAARKEGVASIHQYLSDLRRQLLDAGVLAERDGVLVFTQDYRFGSPSTAAGVLVGSATNGRQDWKDAKGRTLKQLQEMALDAPGVDDGE